MIWRIMQLALCVIIWSVLISVALFKLNPVVGSTSTPVGTQSIKSKSVQASKNKRKSDIECDNESRSESIINEKLAQDLFRRIAKSLEQRSNRDFTSAVNAKIQVILWIKFEIQPRSTIRDNAR